MAKPEKNAAQDPDITPEQVGELMDQITATLEESASILARLKQVRERVHTLTLAAQGG